MIICLSGLKGSGKDTVGDILIQQRGFKRISFADPLKELCCTVTRLPIETFHDVNLKDKQFNEPLKLSIDIITHLAFEFNEMGYRHVTPSTFLKYLNHSFMTPRDILLLIGTEVGRNLVNNTIWLDLAIDKIKKTNSHVVVTDARFQNERDLLKKNGAVKVFVDRPEKTAIFDAGKAHISELDMLNDNYDVLIKNDTSIGALKEEILLWFDARIKAY